MAWQEKALAAIQESTEGNNGMLREAVEPVEISEPMPASSNSIVSARSLRT